ncbi:LLM class flavin-dependent oxidoreductase [Streptomyces djakartensis]|uniref:LLM class flavin-dependent oxidoreductase n=1 Tax=Streptomyces djakartensis TaxID=68193 RepID=UPI0034DF8EA4
MRIGVVLPTMVPSRPPASVTSYAKLAENEGFSTVAAFDRLVYDSYEPFTALTAAAAVTHRISLMTALAISPLRLNTALFAKQVSTIDHFSSGRLVLGLGVGVREDDFEVSRAPMKGRGSLTDRQILEMRHIWANPSLNHNFIGPPTAHTAGPPLILGGHTPVAIRRAARFADGWIAGSGGTGVFEHGSALFMRAWQEADRQAKPLRKAVSYFALGREAATTAESYLSSYLSFTETAYVQRVLRSTPTDGGRLRSCVERYAALGCDELLLAPCTSDISQLELLIGELAGFLGGGGLE